MIPEKAVKMTPEITDDPRYSSTCDGRKMVEDDRNGGREGREIERGDEEVAGGVDGDTGKTMNTEVKP